MAPLSLRSVLPPLSQPVNHTLLVPAPILVLMSRRALPLGLGCVHNNDVATVFERMLVTYETGNDKILYIGALPTDNAKTWYLANEQKRKPDSLSGWTVWVTYKDFLKDFIAIHENKNKVCEAKRNLQME